MHDEVPPSASRGACPCLSVLCRSAAEAEQVWQLQSTIETVEMRGRRAVAAALLMNVVVRKLFVNDSAASFHAAFLGFFNRPVVYLSW